MKSVAQFEKLVCVFDVTNKKIEARMSRSLYCCDPLKCGIFTLELGSAVSIFSLILWDRIHG